MEGYHIHIRDMSSKDPHFDVVTLSGGGTRSHTLSDLRPDTKYSIFLLPYHQQITGNPSNLKTVTTKEDGKLCEFFNTILSELCYFAHVILLTEIISTKSY